MSDDSGISGIIEAPAEIPSGNGKHAPTAAPVMSWVAVPADAPEPPPSKGSQRHWYHTMSGELSFAVDRHEPRAADDRKLFFPLTLWEREDGSYSWQAKHAPAPRPPYNLHKIAQYPDMTVLVVEGEKAADAAAKLFPGRVVVTSSGGANAARQTDWSSLEGRDVVIWPDNDEAGRKYARDVGKLARAAGARSVHVVDVPRDWPECWDLAEETPPGITAEQLCEMIEQAAEFPPSRGSRGSRGSRRNKSQRKKNKTCTSSQTPEGFRPGSEGSENQLPHGFKRAQNGSISYEEAEGEWVWLCSSIEVEASTRNEDGEAWGRLVRVRDRDGIWHEWAMPMAELAGGGEAYRARLLSMGLELAPGTKARNALHRLLTAWTPRARARCVDRLGWHGAAYVLPDEVIGQPDSEERIVLQTGAPLRHPLNVAGTLQGWQDAIGKTAVGNSRVAFSISMAFAGPLLHPLGIEGGGFHFRGGSSIGKTTLAHAAGSVCGGGPNGYLSSWRTTDNALEGVAALHNDGLLVLDEMSQVDADSAYEVAYLLANGQAKRRMSRDAVLRAAPTWRLLFLSTGEIGLADKLRESRRNRRATAGQQVRVIDLEADAGEQRGVFETLHGFARAQELADHLKSAAAAHCGHALRAFINRVVANPDALERAREFIDGFVAKVVPSEADGQVRRVARRFAVVAAAGELARDFGVVPWPEGEAMKAAARLFDGWLASRGGIEPAEISAGLSAVRRFIELNGTSRFAPWDEPASVVYQRAGYWRKCDGDDVTYYVLPEAWRQEVLPGHDAGLIARELGRRGMLKTTADGKPQTKQRLPDNTERKVYVLLPTLFNDEEAAP